MFEDSVRVDDQSVTKLKNEIKKNIKYDYQMEDYNEYKTI
mgnify:CR=1 FL=1